MTANEDVAKYRKEHNRIIAETVAGALDARNFEVFVCDSFDEARETALSLMPEGSTVGWGGSASIDQIGLVDAVRSGKYTPIDRTAAKTPEERDEIVRRIFSADFFLTSFNAVSLAGNVFNVDGMGNRVAAITFGPRNVIAIVGTNKICHSDESARERILGTAAEINAIRFGKGDTLFTDDDVTDDIPSEDRICNFIEEIAWCRPKGRIKVILVTEDLGF